MNFKAGHFDFAFRREEKIVLEGRFRNQKRSCLISGMTDFAYSNDYILLKNFKLQNLLTTWHTRGLIDLRVLFFILSANLFTKSRFPNLEHRCKARSAK